MCKTKPWGQGPVFLQQLALLDGFDLKAMGPGSADYLHTVTECAKLAFADREAWYGDPDFTDVPVKALLSAEYADARRRLVGAEALADLVPGAPEGRQPGLPGFITGSFHANGGRAGYNDTSVAPSLDVEPPAPRLDPGTGEPTMRTSAPGGSTGPVGSSYRAGDTCHLDVADRFGNMVSATPSGGWLQSSPVIPGLGFCLGTRAQMFTLTPGLPATLAPGKRPRTTLTPSLALRDREPYLAFGTPGGDQQDQWSLLFFLNHLHFGMNLQQAIDFPSFHSAHMPSSFYPREAQPRVLDVESRVGAAVIEELRCRGTSSRRGRSAGSARCPATAACSTPPPTPAACKATPSAVNPLGVEVKSGSRRRSGAGASALAGGIEPGAQRRGDAGSPGDRRRHEQRRGRQHAVRVTQDG